MGKYSAQAQAQAEAHLTVSTALNTPPLQLADLDAGNFCMWVGRLILMWIGVFSPQSTPDYVTAHGH